jgi:hypothetical protein
MDEGSFIIAAITIGSIFVCYFYLYLIRIGAIGMRLVNRDRFYNPDPPFFFLLADLMKCLRRVCGRKVKVKPEVVKEKKKKKPKKVKVKKEKKPYAGAGKKKKGVIRTGHEVGRAWDPSRYGGSEYDDEIQNLAKNYSHGEGSRGGQAAGSGPGV